MFSELTLSVPVPTTPTPVALRVSKTLDVLGVLLDRIQDVRGKNDESTRMYEMKRLTRYCLIDYWNENDVIV